MAADPSAETPPPTFYVYWCPRCNVQAERSWHLCRRGPPLFPQMDEETQCERVDVVPVRLLEELTRERDELQACLTREVDASMKYWLPRQRELEATLARAQAVLDAAGVPEAGTLAARIGVLWGDREALRKGGVDDPGGTSG